MLSEKGIKSCIMEDNKFVDLYITSESEEKHESIVVNQL